MGEETGERDGVRATEGEGETAWCFQPVPSRDAVPTLMYDRHGAAAARGRSATAAAPSRFKQTTRSRLKLKFCPSTDPKPCSDLINQIHRVIELHEYYNIA